MEFTEIDDDSKVYPGEYVYHEPSNAIALAGAFNKDGGFIRALLNGQYLEDKISNFKKIKLSDKERKEKRTKKCGGCKGI